MIVQVTLESHTDETLYDFGRVLATIPEIQEAYLVSGDYDYYIRIAVRDTRDYERLLREKLYKIPGIRHSKSHFVPRAEGNQRAGHLRARASSFMGGSSSARRFFARPPSLSLGATGSTRPHRAR